VDVAAGILNPERAPTQADRRNERSAATAMPRIVPLGEVHLRAAVSASVHHYYEERHSIMKNATARLNNERIAPTTIPTELGPIQCRERLGGVLTFYYREAA
jgi:hypothetical protein